MYREDREAQKGIGRSFAEVGHCLNGEDTTQLRVLAQVLISVVIHREAATEDADDA